MSFNFKKFWEGLRIVPKTSSTADSKGDLEVIDSTGKLGYHNGTTVSPVVTEAHPATLTNKGVDADNNTVSNLEVDNLKAGVLNTDTALTGATDTQIPSALAVKTFVDNSTSAVQADVDDLVTLTGVPVNSTDLGTFTGNVIGDNATIKQAFQDVEDAVELVAADLGAHILDAVDAHDASAISVVPTGNLVATDAQSAFVEHQDEIDDLVTLSGVPSGSTDLGTFTGATIPDGSDNKEAFQALETALEAHVNDTTDAHDATAISVDLSAIPILGIANVNEALIDLYELDADNVDGPASSTDNGIAVFNGTSGKTIKNTDATVTGTGGSTVLTVPTVSTDTINPYQGDYVTVNGGVYNNGVEGYIVNEDLATGSDANIDATFGSTFILTNSGLVSVKTITIAVDGQRITLINNTGNDITIVNSSVASGIKTGTGADLTLANEASISLTYTNISGKWMVVGGTGSGTGGGTTDPDVLVVQTFDEATVSDFTQTGLSLVSTNPIHGAQTALLTHQAGTSQSFAQTIDVDPKFRGVNITAAMLVRSTASDGNVTFTVTDVTNATTLTTQSIQTDSQAIASLTTTNSSTTVSGFTNSSINTLEVGMSVTGTGIAAGTRIASISASALTITLSAAATASGTVTLRFSALPKTVQLGFSIPTNCSSITYTVTALQESGSPETYVDDIVLRNYFLGMSNQGQSEIIIPTVESQSSYLVQSASFGNAVITGALSSSVGSGIYSYNAGTGIYTVLVDGNFSIDCSLEASGAAAIQASINVDGVIVAIDSSAATAGSRGSASYSGVLTSGQTFSISNSTANTTNGQRISVLAQAVTETTITHSDLVPAKAVLGNTAITVPTITEWTDFVPTGSWVTNTTYSGKYRQVGEDLEIQYKWTTSGAPTAAALTLQMPDGYTIDTNKLPTTNTTTILGQNGFINDSSGTAFNECVGVYSSASTIAILAVGTAATYANTNASVTNTVPITWGATDYGSITVKVPAVGLSATEEIVVSGTQAGTVEEPDSSITVSTANGFGATGTKIRRFSSFVSSEGSDVLYADSSVNGASFTIQTDGIYSITYHDNGTTASYFGISKNVSSLTTNVSTLATGTSTTNEILASTWFATGAVGNCSWTGPLVAGDVIRPHTDGTVAQDNDWSNFTIVKQGKLTQVNVNADQKITIPTSELRFEGASSRGAVATAIVKFDTLAKIRGDAFTVTNTANDGTYVTMTKAGRLIVTTNLNLGASNEVQITKNQQTLTAVSSTTSEILSTQSSSSALFSSVTASTDVIVGDIIRVSTNITPTASTRNNLLFSFQEQSIQVSVSNTLPQFSESDSSVRLDGTAGYGSTATKIRRFSNIRQNIGTDIVYTDSATSGGSFTIQESGTYNISYSDNFTSGDNMGITKNASSLTTNIQSLVASEILCFAAAVANSEQNVSWEGYLEQGDVIRAHTQGTAAANSANVFFTISKVGKPNVTGVDVTPFIEIPQPEKQSLVWSRVTSSTTVDFASGVTNASSGSGIFSVSGQTLTALKECHVNTTYRVAGTVTVAASGAGISITISSSNGANNGSRIQNQAALSTNNGTSLSVRLLPGETISYAISATNVTVSDHQISVIAEALSDQILTAPETFSTDTAPLTYAGSSTYTLSTLANAPVGTFITYTYATSTNTRTQTNAAAPTQTTSSMNTNGIQIFTRAYNAASTSGSPSTIAIQIGKGMKGVSLALFSTTGKTTTASLDKIVYSSTTEFGCGLKEYNETTGILYIDTAVVQTSTTISSFRYEDGTSGSSGYLVINASKNPALTGMNVNRVAARYTSNAGQAIGTSATLLTYEDVDFDNNNAYTAGSYTVPETGYYDVKASFLTATQTLGTGQRIIIDIYVNGVSRATASTMGTGAGNNPFVSIEDTLYLTKGQTVSIYGLSNVATTMNTGSTFNRFSISKAGF